MPGLAALIASTTPRASEELTTSSGGLKSPIEKRTTVSVNTCQTRSGGHRRDRIRHQIALSPSRWEDECRAGAVQRRPMTVPRCANNRRITADPDNRSARELGVAGSQSFTALSAAAAGEEHTGRAGAETRAGDSRRGRPRKPRPCRPSPEAKFSPDPGRRKQRSAGTIRHERTNT